jgi:peptide/nickel transport system permease protein
MILLKPSRTMGASGWWVIGRHILPSLTTPLLVEATYALAGLIIAEASLSFLGLGLQAPEASWGAMMRDSVRYLLVSPHYAIFVGISIMSIVYCINAAGDYLHGYWNIKSDQNVSS